MIFRFAFPWAFALLPLAVLAAWAMARRRKRSDAHLPLPRASHRIALGVSPWVRLERALPWLRGIAMVLVVVAIARPQAGEKKETLSTHGVDIVVVLEDSTTTISIQVLERALVSPVAVAIAMVLAWHQCLLSLFLLRIPSRR